MNHRRFNPWIVGAIAIVLGVGRYLAVIDEPWDRSLGSVNGAVYFSRFEQSYERLGFGALGGAPYFYVLPLNGPTQGTIYWHHPPLIPWALRAAVALGGYSERTFRCLPILLSTLTGFLLALVAGKARGTWAGVSVAALFAALPMSWITGWQVGYEPVTLGFMTLAVWLHLRLRVASLRKYSLVCMALACAVWTDWIGAAVVPGLLVTEILRANGERRVWRTCLLGAVAAVCVLVIVGVFGAWQGLSLREAIEAVAGLGRVTTTGSTKPALGTWIDAQLGFWARLYGIPVAAASLLVCARFWRAARRGDEMAACAWALVIPAVANVVAFPGHSVDHEFWWAYAVPWAVLASVECARLLPGRARVLAIGALAIVLASSSAGEWRRVRDDECRALGADFDRVAAPTDGLIYPGAFSASGFYVHAWYFDYGALGGVEAFEELARLRRASGLRVPRVVAVGPEGPGSPFLPENLARLEAIGHVRRLEPADAARELPALARAHVGKVIWIVTIG